MWLYNIYKKYRISISNIAQEQLINVILITNIKDKSYITEYVVDVVLVLAFFFK